VQLRGDAAADVVGLEARKRGRSAHRASPDKTVQDNIAIVAPGLQHARGGAAMSDTTTRVERDTMGEMEVPKEAYYGASTQRAVINFPVSGIRLPRRFLRAMGLIKKAAAQVNRELGLLDAKVADAIAQ